MYIYGKNVIDDTIKNKNIKIVKSMILLII